MSMSKKEVRKKAKRQLEFLRKELPRDLQKAIDKVRGPWGLTEWVSLAISKQLTEQLKNPTVHIGPTPDEVYEAQEAIDKRGQKINVVRMCRMKPRKTVRKPKQKQSEQKKSWLIRIIGR